MKLISAKQPERMEITSDANLPVVNDTVKTNIDTGVKIDSASYVSTDLDTAHPDVRLINVSTKEFDCVLSTSGADIISIKFKSYHYKDGKSIEVLSPLATGSCIDIDFFRGQSIVSASKAHYTSDKDNLTLTEYDSLAAITFNATLTDGSRIQRRYEFSYEGFRIVHSLVVESPEIPFDQAIVWWRKGICPTETNIKEELTSFAYVHSLAGSVEKVKFNKKKPLENSANGSTDFVATNNKYFGVIVSPVIGKADGGRASGYFRKLDTLGQSYDYPVIGAGLYYTNTGNVLRLSDEFVITPLEYFGLKAYGKGFEKIVDTGWKWLSPLSVGMLWVFRLYIVLSLIMVLLS
jgi:YidC/Oxa1 family membrane protein insertase